jgi:hypothetical protein
MYVKASRTSFLPENQFEDTKVAMRIHNEHFNTEPKNVQNVLGQDEHKILVISNDDM